MRAHLRRDPLHLLGCAQRHQLHSTDQALRPPPYAPFARPRRAAALPLRHGTMCYLPTGIKPVRWELLATKVYSPPTGRGSLPSRSATSAPTACRLAPSPSPKLTATMTATATATAAQSGLHRRAPSSFASRSMCQLARGLLVGLRTTRISRGGAFVGRSAALKRLRKAKPIKRDPVLQPTI